MENFEFPNNKVSRILRQKRRDKRLAEELIECRRYGGGDENKKARQKGERKLLQQRESNGFFPTQESIRYKSTTIFSDNLEPLERFLRSHVGQPWSEVYAKLSQQLDRSTVSGEHVFQHLQDYMGKSRWQWHTTFQQYRVQNDGVSTRFGIHPVSGLLCIVNPKSPISSGPFSKQARFKKAKQRLKLKLRLGLEQKSRPQKPVLDAKNWFRQFVDQQVVAPGGSYKWSDLLHRNVDFWKGNLHIILNLNKMEWANFPVEIWKGNTRTMPANRLQGRLWVKSSQMEKPLRISFSSIWMESWARMLGWEER